MTETKSDDAMEIAAMNCGNAESSSSLEPPEVTMPDANPSDPGDKALRLKSSFRITPYDYLGGIADLTGELMR